VRDLKDALILITGASSGIGRVSAVQFAREGARVLAIARNAERLAELANEAAGRLTTYVADVADDDGMAALAERVLADHGAPDIVVANAGIGLDARFENTTDGDARAVFETNVLGVFRTVRPYLPAMVERGSGRILIVSSVVGKRGIPNYAAYSGSKFALHGMAGALRTELRGTGVTVGLICPSSTTTGFHDRVRKAGPAQRRVRIATHTPESVADAILRMARSDRREVVLSLEAKAMSFVEKFAPGVLDFILHRTLVRKAD
jgi:short-subunit dehydrogenase